MKLGLLRCAKNRLSAFDHRVSKTFGPKREGVTGDCSKWYSEIIVMLLTEYFSGDETGERWTGREASVDVRRALVGTTETKRPLETLRRRREDNIKIDLQEIGWDGGE
jgi:hypothetical protein